MTAIDDLEEHEQYWWDLEAEHHRLEKPFTILVSGAAAVVLEGKKKRAGHPATRGNYVTNAIRSHERLPYLEEKINFLEQSIASLQKLLETGN